MNKNTIKAPCTILLAAVNVIVFLVLSFLGMTEDGEFMKVFFGSDLRMHCTKKKEK